ncbi:putative response regulatory protein [Paenibacillus nuruki]|uniref:Putative response regulatory protein n=1 Tax=Paenibacillus nuruki TaxID=1886670 RepID=A0A1E3KXN9_9BACL|nr:response regulator [Paenibacillus nuruki]ODP26234.1 putative response regulatory protein [Paenibacillus nuruki]
MYKVLLVDDERMILEGISQVVNWQESGTELIGTARNGLEAYEQIQANCPDIVISDISMPGLDGIGLVAKTHASFPDVRFIMLSGHKDFDYARRAMQYGVKHYLVKPCNERQIQEAISELLSEREVEHERDQFVNSMKEQFTRMLPQVKEQFLKEFIANKMYGVRDLDYYEQLFHLNLRDRPVRMALMRVEESHEYEHLFALKNIADDLLDGVLMGTTIHMQDELLLLLDDPTSISKLISDLEHVQNVFAGFYKLEVTIALSEPDYMISLRRMYRDTQQCMNHRFYVGEGSIITKSDLALADQKDSTSFELDEEAFTLLIKSGQMEEVTAEIDRLFVTLAEWRHDIGVTRSYVLQLYAVMIRLCLPEERSLFTSRMAELAMLDTLTGLHEFVQEAAAYLTMSYYKSNVNRQSSVVNKMIQIIEQNYTSAELSLNGVANQMLYMNPDYLGKIFKKVTGDNFSHYVNRYRIERSTDHIRRSGDVKVFELAELFGFGGNSQYFSQVFKKWTGMTPTEYRKSEE